jgi:hypothetical protein
LPDIKAGGTQGCQIFLGTTYQNGKMDTKKYQNGHETGIPKFSISRPSKDTKN